MKVLLAITNEAVRLRIHFALESRYSAEVHDAGSVKDGITLLEDHRDIGVVICEYPAISESLLRHVAAQSRQAVEKPQIPVILCGSAKPKNNEFAQGLEIAGFAPWAGVIESLFAVLDETEGSSDSIDTLADTSEGSQDPLYCRIRTALLIRIGMLQADIYIRLSSRKYIKLFHEGDAFDEQDYAHYLEEKKLDYLYLKRTECEEFLLKFKNDLLALLSDEMLKGGGAPELVTAIHETAHELLNKLGPTPEVQAVVKANVAVTIAAIGKTPNLAKMLDRLKVDPDKYISSHSTLLPEIACTLAMEMSWNSAATLQKLALAAFLHDITLTNEKIAMIRTPQELKKQEAGMTDAELKEYRNHPQAAAELAKRFNEVPPDVDVIIFQHHESGDGTGFPRSLSHMHISPLSSVFIVAHDIVSDIFALGKDFSMPDFIARNQERYSGGNFRKLLKCLNEVKL